MVVSKESLVLKSLAVYRSEPQVNLLSAPAMAKTVLVTGGAGYIGSHTVLQLVLSGFKAVVVDNLDNSSEVAIKRVAELAGEFGKNIDFYKVFRLVGLSWFPFTFTVSDFFYFCYDLYDSKLKLSPTYALCRFYIFTVGSGDGTLSRYFPKLNWIGPSSASLSVISAFNRAYATVRKKRTSVDYLLNGLFATNKIHRSFCRLIFGTRKLWKKYLPPQRKTGALF